MHKEIILYNLKDSVNDEAYREYCETRKGPLIRSLPSCRNFSLVRVTGSVKGVIPYAYVGIVEVTSLEEWQRDAESEPFRNFLTEWIPMVSDFHILTGADFF